MEEYANVYHLSGRFHHYKCGIIPEFPLYRMQN